MELNAERQTNLPFGEIKMTTENKGIISVIIPVYKVEQYLDKCVESVVNQTYSNLEIILVDDGSPDGCPRKCDQWAKKDERIKVIHKTNGGLSDARNAGLKIATGDYIAFVDSDDFLELDMYEFLIYLITSSNSDMAICGLEYVDVNGVMTRSNCRGQDACLSSKEVLAKWCIEDLVYYVVVWNKLYKRKCWEGVSFPKGKIHEDNFVMYKVFFNSNNIVCTKQKKYNYVQRSGSITSGGINPKRYDAVQATYEAYKFYQENGLADISDVIVKWMSGTFFSLNGCINIFKCTSEEKKYIKDIKRLFYNTYFVEAGQNNIKDYMKYYFPNAVRAIKKILHCGKAVASLCNYGLLSRNKVVLIDTPTHGNLGDHAIVLAEQKLLNQCGVKSYELTAMQVNEKEDKYASITPMNQYIVVPGGGFLGALWPGEEERFRRIVKAFNKQKIIVFPQTITFDTTTQSGRKYLAESQKIYASHPDLTIFVREKRSYAFMQEYFPTVKCKLVPDIVTMLTTPEPNNTSQMRSGVLFCMRHDLEKAVDDSVQEEMLSAVRKQYPNENIAFTDTVIDHGVKPKNREAEVNKKLSQFSKSRLVITDRLHGMILAAITNTPCIAMTNSNGKVKAVYEWIKENEYIRFANSIDEFKQQLSTLDLNKRYKYNRGLVEHEFEPLLEEIRKMCE